MSPAIKKRINAFIAADAFIEEAMKARTAKLVLKELVLITTYQNDMRCLFVSIDGLKYCKIYADDFNSIAVTIKCVIADYFS